MTKYSLSDLLTRSLGIFLVLFTLVEVNYPLLSPQARLALFAMLGLILCLLFYRSAKVLDLILVLLTLLSFSFVFIQTELMLQDWWLGGSSLGNRAGRETWVDVLAGSAGLLVVLETTRRSIGWTLPFLSGFFIAYAYCGPYLPEWMVPHRGYPLTRIISQVFLQSQGVFGVALSVMFTYVFLFILLGALLRVTGTSQFIVDFAQWCFGRGSGGPAKVAVLSSGLMGSLSGSAVANTVTTGTFTIPMMRASGLKPHLAAAVTAAASSGGALMPPVMGAGAYMMLEIVSPPVTYLQIIQAALIPAVLYYLSLFLLVHFQSKQAAAQTASTQTTQDERPAAFALPFEGILLAVAFISLIAFLIVGYTPFRAVSLTLIIMLCTGLLNARTRLTLSQLREAMTGTARDAVPLICAAACVGIIIGVVTLTGLGSRIPALLLPLAEGSLILALGLIMVSTIILGMGLPSAVSYLLMASLIGPVLGQLGIVPLSGHLFIFYFGMMSMVTPPVALAAYAAASIAGTPIMQTSMAAFRFALVGFTLPFMFVFRPQLLMLSPGGGEISALDVAAATAIAALGILALAGAMAGHLIKRLSLPLRILLLFSAGSLLYPGGQLHIAGWPFALHDLIGLMLLVVAFVLNYRAAERRLPTTATGEETGIPS